MLYLVRYYIRKGKRVNTVVTAENLNAILDALRCSPPEHACATHLHHIAIETIKEHE